eukprot:PLAT3149.1.p1 GENE.PLAT3149.1~~PLAT3149.1.p1  ORF type:complete len:508 (-),score=86.27 PLAT3149.1:116-1639(-)
MASESKREKSEFYSCCALLACPEDVLGVVVELLNCADAMRLASASQRLRRVVHARQRVLTTASWHKTVANLARRLPRLEEVQLSSEAALADALGDLHVAVPQLRKLSLRLPAKYDASPLLACLPHMACLDTLVIAGLYQTGSLGSVLARCGRLRSLHLLHSDRYMCHADAAFVIALRECTMLQQLCGLYISDPDARNELAVTAGCWAEMERLDLSVSRHSEGVLPALAASCTRLKRLKLSYCHADAEAVSGFTALERLVLAGAGLPAAFFDTLINLGCLTRLTHLHLVECTSETDGNDWHLLPAFLSSLLGLRDFRFVFGRKCSPDSITSPLLVDLFDSLCALDKLRSVHVDLTHHAGGTRDYEADGVLQAAVSALASSHVEQWQLIMNDGGLPLLKLWKAAPLKAAGVRRLSLGSQPCGGIAASKRNLQLLLRCLRSCATLLSAEVFLFKLDRRKFAALLALLREQPLWPVMLTVWMHPHVADKVLDGEDGPELRSLGLIVKCVSR